MPVGDQVREAVEQCGLSNRQICQRISTDESQFSRFRRGRVGLSMAVLNELGAVLDLRVSIGPNSAKPSDFVDRRRKTTRSK